MKNKAQISNLTFNSLEAADCETSDKSLILTEEMRTAPSVPATVDDEAATALGLCPGYHYWLQ